MEIPNKTNVIIINNCLRLTDNPLLENLKGPTIFVFCLTPYYFSKAHYTDIPTVGENRFKYLFSCLIRFKEQLKERFNCDLLVLEGTYKTVIDQIKSLFINVEIRVLHQPYLYEVMYEQELLDSEYNKINNCVYIIKDGYTLLPFNVAVDLYKKNREGSFSSFFNSYSSQKDIIRFIDNSNLNVEVVDVSSVTSIEGDADNINFFYDFDNIVGYSINRNYISGSSTVKCEAALSLGTISKVMAYAKCLSVDTIVEDKMAFIRSLIWADYCYVIAEVEGDKIFYKDGISKNLNINCKLEVLPDWIKGVGLEVKFYNKTITALKKYGYITNRHRMLFGYYVIKVMGYSHLALAEFLEHYLLNGNVANNWLGCQSCNGTGVDTIVGGRNFSIRKQLNDYDLNGDYK